MKNSSVIVLGSALAVVFLAACESDSDFPKNRGSSRFGYRGNSTQYAYPTPTPEGYTDQLPATPTPTPPTQEPSPTPLPPPTLNRDLSYGTPVPGKPGFVTSPHSPFAGYVDVRGFPPGTEVKCPYSGKIFLVP